jgi:hypothetical protein
MKTNPPINKPLYGVSIDDGFQSSDCSIDYRNSPHDDQCSLYVKPSTVAEANFQPKLELIKPTYPMQR